MQNRISEMRLPTPVGVVGGVSPVGIRPPGIGPYSTTRTPIGSPNCDKVRATERATPFEDIIRSAARREGLDENLVKAVVETESRFDPKAVSLAGAKGLMQLMDGTAKALGVEDPFDPVANVKGGVKFLRSMLDRFGSIPLALAAYNAGPGTVEQYGGVPPYSETRVYIDKVMRLQQLNASTEPDAREEGGNGGHPIG